MLRLRALALVVASGLVASLVAAAPADAKTRPPVVRAISAHYGSTAGGTLVTITGSGFVRVTSVRFGGTLVKRFKASGMRLVVVAPRHSAGTVDVRVYTRVGGSRPVRAGRFTYIAPPTVASVSPASGSTSGGTRVTLTGSSFRPGASVRFGANAGASVSVISAHQLQVTAPAGTAGVVDVRVSTAFGTSPVVAGDRFSFVAPAPPTPTPPGPVPTAPSSPVTSLGAQTVGLAAIGLSWAASASSNVTAVMIRRGDGAPPTSPSSGLLVANLPPSATTHTDAGLASGATYGYAVFACNSAGCSASATTTGRAGSTTLPAGQVLTAGQALFSGDGVYEAIMQGDGNFVVYHVGAGPLWASGTGTPGSWLSMQPDGNLVVYNPSGAPLFSTSTSLSESDTLSLQTDGNLVVYSHGGLPLWSWQSGRTAYNEDTLPTGAALQPGQALWSLDGRYTATMQPDGNFVVYPAGQAAIWASGTGTAGSYVSMQADGNLVIYSPSGAVWSSGTAPSSNDRLVMQSDGNLVIYGAAGAVWALGSRQMYGHVIGDDYPANLRSAAQDSITDPWSFYNRECTSFVAWRLNNTNHVGFTDYYGGPQWGNADNWGPTAKSLGIRVDNTPQVGAVAWSSSGHVAWVADIRPDGTIDVEEYNYGHTGAYHTRTVSAGAFTGYIHIADIG